MRCSVHNCRSDSEQKIPGLSFHSFPYNPAIRKKWIAACGRNKWVPKKCSKICSRHFDADHILKKGRYTYIHPEAVPLIMVLAVTAGSTPSFQTYIPDPMPELSHFITDIKSELDPVEMKEDPQSDDTVSLDEEDQLSDADQPCEDLIPLSNDQVPLTNAQDPLTEVKEEEPEDTVDEAKVKVEEVEVTEHEVQVTGPGVPAMQVPLRQVLRPANDDADLICSQSEEIAKLTARCNHTQRQLNNMVQLLRRRDNTISCLRAERDQLAGYLARRGAGAGAAQIQSVNNTVEEKKPNRKLFIIKRNRKSFVKSQPTTSLSATRTSQMLQNTSENGQKTSVLKSTFDIPESSDTGVKRSLNIVERASLGIKDKSSTLNKSSVDDKRTSKIQKSPVGLKQTPFNRRKPTIIFKPLPEIIKCPSLVQPKSDNRQVSSVRVQQSSSFIRRKPSITIKQISEIIQSPSLVVQPLSENRQISSVGVQSLSENRQMSSLGAQPKPDVRQMLSANIQRTSDMRQNAVVIQIDGMHKTVLQPTLVRLDDYK